MKHIDIDINLNLNLPTIDKFIYKLGYKKVTQKNSLIRYSRKNTMYGYTQIVEINRKHDGVITINSYSANDFCTDSHGLPLGNCSVSLTPYEMILFAIKSRKLRKNK